MVEARAAKVNPREMVITIPEEFNGGLSLVHRVFFEEGLGDFAVRRDGSEDSQDRPFKVDGTLTDFTVSQSPHALAELPHFRDFIMLYRALIKLRIEPAEIEQIITQNARDLLADLARAVSSVKSI